MSKSTKKKKLLAEDCEYYARRLKWAHQYQESFAGLWYTDDLAGPDGVAITFFVAEKTSAETIAAAKRKAVQARDVVSFRLLTVDEAFLEEAEGFR